MITFNGLSLTNKEVYGVHRYCFEILYELDKIVGKNEVELIVPNDGERDISFHNISVIKKGSTNSKNPIMKIIKKMYWNDHTFKKIVKKHKSLSIDLTLNFPSFGCDIVAVHDCIPNLFPEQYTSKKDKLFRFNLLKRQKRAIRKAKFVVTVSNSAKKDIIRFYNISEEKIIIIPNSWQHFNRIDEDANVMKRLKLNPGGYFFSLGSKAPNKNIQWTLNAARQNPKEMFVLTGSSSVFESYKVGENEKLENVIFTGFLPDGEIKALMHYSKAFIQPSLYEGFGIPPLEAMSVGAKCIVSTASSLPEIYEDSVWYIEPNIYENIDLNSIMRSEIKDNSLILNKYSWQESAKKIYNLTKLIRK